MAGVAKALGLVLLMPAPSSAIPGCVATDDPTDCHALLQLWSTANGKNWNVKWPDAKLLNTSMCTWSNVNCTSDTPPWNGIHDRWGPVATSG